MVVEVRMQAQDQVLVQVLVRLRVLVRVLAEGAGTPPVKPTTPTTSLSSARPRPRSGATGVWSVLRRHVATTRKPSVECSRSKLTV